MKSIIRTSAVISLGMGLVFLISWHLGLSSILQLSPSTWPIPYPAALCLFLSGLGFFTLFSSFQFPLSKILGMTIFLIGFQRFAELLFPPEATLNLFFNNLRFYPSNSSKMVLLAAIGFMLAGLLFVLWPKKNSLVKSIFLLFISVLVVFLGSIGILFGILPIKIHSELQKILLHFYTSIGLFVIGFGFIFAKLYENSTQSSLQPEIEKEL